MVICPQCNLEHDVGEEFCKKCGKFLLAIEDPIPEEEKMAEKRICPKCYILYRKGNYCRRCGSLLMQGNPLQDKAIPLRGKSIQRRIKEWQELVREKEELESCLNNLKAQQGKNPIDVLPSLLVQYQDRLESLSTRLQDIQVEMEGVRKKAIEEIDCLKKGLLPIQKRLEGFQALYQSKAVTKTDFAREKKERNKEIRSVKRNLKKYQHLLALLLTQGEGNTASFNLSKTSLKPSTLLVISILLVLFLVGGYFVLQHSSLSSQPISEEIPTPLPRPHPFASDAKAPMVSLEDENIKSLFEDIKQANLKKNIDLFMSCYSSDFNDRERKRLDALEMWNHYHYLNLSYILKNQTISGETAHVRLEWLIQFSKKGGGRPEDQRTLMDVTLKKEDGRWKIKEIKSIG